MALLASVSAPTPLLRCTSYSARGTGYSGSKVFRASSGRRSSYPSPPSTMSYVKPKGLGQEEARVHRIRITLTSKNVRNLEKGKS